MSRGPDLNYEMAAYVAVTALGKAMLEWAEFMAMLGIACVALSLGSQ